MLFRSSLAFEFPLWHDLNQWDRDPVVLSAVDAELRATEENSTNLAIYRAEMKKARRLPIRYALSFPLAMALYSHMHFRIIEIFYFLWWIGFLALPFRWMSLKVKNLEKWPHGERLFAPYRDLCRQISQESRGQIGRAHV